MQKTKIKKDLKKKKEGTNQEWNIGFKKEINS